MVDEREEDEMIEGEGEGEARCRIHFVGLW